MGPTAYHAARGRRRIRRPVLSLLLPLLLCACVAPHAAAQGQLTRRQYEEDFDYLWQRISDDYAYLDRKQTDWNKVRELYRPAAGAVASRGDFVALLERVIEELYDPHAHLNTNTASSPRLVPSGADIWAEWAAGRAVVTEVRPGTEADRAGVRAGMIIASVNGAGVEEAARGRLGKCLRAADPAAMGWALRALLAGRRGEARSIEVVEDGGRRRAIPLGGRRPAEAAAPKPLLEYRRLARRVGYIRVNNSLGDVGLVGRFDEALARLADTSGLILDLRDTPAGGNTTVARGIMGRFVAREAAYQKHSLPAEERRYGTKRSWLELVSPRGPFTYRAPVVVLVNHWTGSMGEGIAVGMDGLRRAAVVGTEMARLAGATSGIRLPNTGVGVTFPTEKLFHVDGTPRESFVPPVRVDLTAKGNGGAGDVILRVGLRKLTAAGPRARRAGANPRRRLTTLSSRRPRGRLSREY